MTGSRPYWTRDGRDWPHREASRFIAADGLDWHVQEMGEGPVALLVHGTGAATHSWRGLAPLLAHHFTIVAPDLPGHGFTGAWRFRRPTLPRMAGALARLLETLGHGAPALAIGHSAGAAILARMALDRAIRPAGLVAVNGALLPFPGAAGLVFPSLAKLLFLNPVTPRLFAWRAGDRDAVERVIRNTGSDLDRQGIGLYARLFRRSGHVAGTLAMMANWDLEPTARALPALGLPLLLIAASGDTAIRPETSMEVERRVPGARLSLIRKAGHLVHEERPAEVAERVVAFAREIGALPPARGRVEEGRSVPEA